MDIITYPLLDLNWTMFCESGPRHDLQQSFGKQNNDTTKNTPEWPSCQIRKIAGCACPGIPGAFSPPPRFSDPDRHRCTCVTHVPLCMPGSLTSGFLWSRWRGKRSRHSRRMCNPRFCVSGGRPIELKQLIDTSVSSIHASSTWVVNDLKACRLVHLNCYLKQLWLSRSKRYIIEIL